MADWLRLPSGLAVNMDCVMLVTAMGEDELALTNVTGTMSMVSGVDADAVRDYLERVHRGERA